LRQSNSSRAEVSLALPCAGRCAMPTCQIVGATRRHQPCATLARAGRAIQAHDLHFPVYGWFTEGFDTVELKLPRRPCCSERIVNLAKCRLDGAFLFALAWRRSAVAKNEPATSHANALRAALSPIAAAFSAVKQALGHLTLLIARQVSEDALCECNAGRRHRCVAKKERLGEAALTCGEGRDRIMRRVGVIGDATQAQLAPAGVLFNC
jgi:hypothetical protein